MRLLTLTAALLLAAWPAVAPAATAQEPRAVVETTVDDVIRILSQKQVPTLERRAQIEKIAWERFDFPTISKLVLAQNWKRLSAEQRSEFIDEFRAYLSRTYGSRIDRYEQEKVEIVSERTEPRGDVTVVTRIVGGQADGVEVQYRLRRRDGGWLFIDVVIEGVSLVGNYRAQFRELLGRGGPDHLLETLRRKNQSGEVDPAAPGTTSASR
jgi:phospholipid transport system substrate-binding protein